MFFTNAKKKFKGHNISSNWIDWACKTDNGFFCWKCQLAALNDIPSSPPSWFYPVVKGIWFDWKWNYGSNSHHSFLKAQLSNWTQHYNERYTSIIFFKHTTPKFSLQIFRFNINFTLFRIKQALILHFPALAISRSLQKLLLLCVFVSDLFQ